MRPVALLLPLFLAAQAVHADTPSIDELRLMYRPTSIGNINRARIEKRELPAGRIKDMLGPYLAQSDAPCAAPLKAGNYTLVPVEMPDRVGFTSSRMSGAGMYMSLPETGVTQPGHSYIAPFLAFDVKMQDGVVLPLREYQRYDLNFDELGSNNFKVDTETLEKSVKVFAQKAVPAKVAAWAEKGCKD